MFYGPRRDWEAPKEGTPIPEGGWRLRDFFLRNLVDLNARGVFLHSIPNALMLSKREDRDTATELHAALRRAGLRQVRFHDLRHSWASNLLAAGFDLVTVSKALGHANVHITLTTYAHAIPKERHGAGDALARLMAQDGNKMETLAPAPATVA